MLVDVLKVENVTKRFDDVSGSLEVLEDVSLTVPHKSLVGIVGPTGCGKTTLLRIITGLDHPTSGRVITNQGHLNNGQRIALVPQHPSLLAWRTLYENVSLPLELAGDDLESKKSDIRNVIASVGLSDFERYRPARMSGGMQARTSLARALVQRPTILLLDEPFASIDEISRSTMYALLVKLLAQYEAAGVLVTHSLFEAVTLCDTVIVLSTRPAVVTGAVDVVMPKEKRLTDPDHRQLVAARGEIRRLLGLGMRRETEVRV